MSDSISPQAQGQVLLNSFVPGMPYMLDINEETRALRAAAAFKVGSFKIRKAAADAWQVSYYKVCRRINGSHSCQLNGGQSHLLNEDEELSLFVWINLQVFVSPSQPS